MRSLRLTNDLREDRQRVAVDPSATDFFTVHWHEGPHPTEEHRLTVDGADEVPIDVGEFCAVSTVCDGGHFHLKLDHVIATLAHVLA